MQNTALSNDKVCVCVCACARGNVQKREVLLITTKKKAGLLSIMLVSTKLHGVTFHKKAFFVNFLAFLHHQSSATCAKLSELKITPRSFQRNRAFTHNSPYWAVTVICLGAIRYDVSYAASMIAGIQRSWLVAPLDFSFANFINPSAKSLELPYNTDVFVCSLCTAVTSCFLSNDSRRASGLEE
jgi:hypothetical protein